MSRKFKTRAPSTFSKMHENSLNGITPFMSEKDDFRHTFLVPVVDVEADPEQPRKVFDVDKLNELAESMKQDGQLQPILVSQLSSGKWKIVAGERRWRAAKLANWSTIQAIPFEGDAISASIMENLQRTDLNPVEEARAIRRLIDHNGWTQREAATNIPLSQSRISRTVKILELPEVFLEEAVKKDIPANVLVQIAREEDRSLREELMDHALKEGLTVSRTLSKRRRTPHSTEKKQDEKPSDFKVFFRKAIPSLRLTLEQIEGGNVELTDEQKDLLAGVSRQIEQLLRA